MTPNAEAPMQQPSWFSKNWKWLVPVGCMVPMVCCGVFGIGAYVAASKMIQSSGAYLGAIAQVNASSEVDEALGTPVTPGMGMTGSVKQQNQDGSADFSVPIEGTKGKGTLRVVASSQNGEWSYTTVLVTTADGKKIDILEPPPIPVPERPDDPEDDEPQDPPEPDGD
jgi:hypothetical protein